MAWWRSPNFTRRLYQSIGTGTRSLSCFSTFAISKEFPMKKLLSQLAVCGLLLLGIFQMGRTNAQDSFDRHALLQSLVDNVILPGYQNFVDASAELETT